MENFKFILFSIIILLGIGVVGYWAVVTLEPGDVHVSKQKQRELEEENLKLEKELAELKSELAALKPAETVEPTNTEPKPTTTPKPTTVTVYKYQTLISELEKLITDNVYMKEKSRGTRVGTIQNFLNLYNNTTKRVDNDYGAGTKTDVINFQKAEGLSADGETGPATYEKMIEWLKEQG